MRKTKEFTIEKGRDKGKKFRITEMDVIKAEKWAGRLFLCLASILELPENSSGINGLSGALQKYGLKSLAKIPYESLEPLYNELLDCCEYLGDGTSSISRPLTEATASEVIEDVSTLFTIRMEVLKLHLDFLGEGEN